MSSPSRLCPITAFSCFPDGVLRYTTRHAAFCSLLHPLQYLLVSVTVLCFLISNSSGPLSWPTLLVGYLQSYSHSSEPVLQQSCCKLLKSIELWSRGVWDARIFEQNMQLNPKIKYSVACCNTSSNTPLASLLNSTMHIYISFSFPLQF